MEPIAIATWKFGAQGAQETIKSLLEGKSVLDAVENGIRKVEDDLQVDSVGIGGAPNSDGIVELDAAIMLGNGRRYGAVAGLRDIKEAISVARRVMEQTPHCLLIGEGARQFAIEQGFKPQNLLIEREKAKWKEWKLAHAPNESHDTVCIIALDQNGNLCVGTSTSGIKYKLPGRVGDTPLVGSGLYCDKAVGAAAATGVGEHIMRYCMSFRIVEEMRRGKDPSSACYSTIKWAISEEPHLRNVTVAVLALDKSGNWGASASREGFNVAIARPEGTELVAIPPA